MTNADLVDMPIAELLAFESMVLDRADEWSFTKYFPDDGPLRRELYPKHMAFFAGGAKYHERLFMAANRIGKCCSKDTLIETDKGPQKIGDVFGAECNVRTWPNNEPRRVLKWVRKPAEECYRITMASGQWVEVPLGHHILTLGGYDTVQNVLIRLPESVFVRPQSSSVLARLTHALGVPRLWGTILDYLGGCSTDSRLGGVLPPTAAGSAQVFAPLPADALKRTSILSCLDGLVHRCSDSLSRFLPRLSIRYDDRLTLGRYALLGCPTFSFGVPSTINKRQNVQQSSNAASPVQSSDATQPHQSQSSSYVIPAIDGNKIVSVYSVGSKELLDMEVEDRHNYIAGGMIHHNTVTGAYETALHLTGMYPHWWVGKRFTNATNGWAAGKTSETTRDIVQLALCGSPDRMGTGMIPSDMIESHRFKQGTNQSLDWISVKHVSGKSSWLGLKAYDQGRKAFEGTAKDFIWLDEEPPLPIYTECLTRTATLNGVIFDTFTPLEGATAMVLSFLAPGIDRV